MIAPPNRLGKHDAEVPIRHLYLHIPFCPKICPYCSFYKSTLQGDLRDDFVTALILELEQQLAVAVIRPETIFFGGGTPTALSIGQLGRLLELLGKRLDLSRLREWTVEMNPATVSRAKADLLLAHGVNRISMGVQSWDPVLLTTLGRVHSVEEARASYAILREAGVPSVNLDLMFAIPGQTRRMWLETLQTTLDLAPDHIAAYSLTYEEDTAFFEALQAGRHQRDAMLDADLFLLGMETLHVAGYQQYEVSNYARSGHACLHNLAYWEGADYLGLGPSAVSTLGGIRRTNFPDTAAYVEALLSGKQPPFSVERLDLGTRRKERLAFSLRTAMGLAVEEVERWGDWLESCRETGWLGRNREGRWVLTAQGRLVADSLAEEFC